MGEEADADLHIAHVSGHRAPVVVVEDPVAVPALVDGIAERAILAHPTAVSPTTTIDDYEPIVGRRCRRISRGWHAGNAQLLTDGKSVRVGDAVRLDDRLNRDAIPLRDHGERVPVLDRDDQGRCSGRRRSRRRRRRRARDRELLADVDPIRIREVVRGHHIGDRHPVSGRDDRQALAVFDGDDKWYCRRGRNHTTGGDPEFLPHVDEIRISETVRRHQGTDRDAVVEGERREAVARLNQYHGLRRDLDRRTQPGGDEQDDHRGHRPAHPTTGGVRHSISYIMTTRVRDPQEHSASTDSRKHWPAKRVSPTHSSRW